MLIFNQEYLGHEGDQAKQEKMEIMVFLVWIFGKLKLMERYQMKCLYHHQLQVRFLKHQLLIMSVVNTCINLSFYQHLNRVMRKWSQLLYVKAIIYDYVVLQQELHVPMLNGSVKMAKPYRLVHGKQTQWQDTH